MHPRNCQRNCSQKHNLKWNAIVIPYFRFIFSWGKKCTIVLLISYISIYHIYIFCFILNSWLKSFRYLQIFYMFFLFLYILFIFSETLLEIANYCRVITSTLDSISLNFDEKLTLHNFYYEIYIKIERRYSKKLYFKFWVFFFYHSIYDRVILATAQFANMNNFWNMNA